MTAGHSGKAAVCITTVPCYPCHAGQRIRPRSNRCKRRDKLV